MHLSVNLPSGTLSRVTRRAELLIYRIAVVIIVLVFWHQEVRV